MIKSIIIGKWLYPLTDQLAAVMQSEGKSLVEYRGKQTGLRVFSNRAELNQQIFRDKTGFG